MSKQPLIWNLEYTGEFRDPASPYIPSEELKESVKLAIALERPLLLMGDPGCGKTKLASAIAFEFTQKNQPLLQEDGLSQYPYLSYTIKSTSRARDLLYIYDAVARLRDAQLASVKQLDSKGLARLQDESQTGYIKFGVLGKAFQSACRTIVLLDEIDKADIDFPNDLLLELDEQRFLIDETQQEIPPPGKTVAPPILIVTSNQERDLPNAFLRRCFFHYFEPPSQEELFTIVKAHFGDKLPDDIANQIIDIFEEVRDETEGQSGKRVGTSELLDWIKALLLSPVGEVPGKIKEGIPFLGTLLKTREEMRQYRDRE